MATYYDVITDEVKAKLEENVAVCSGVVHADFIDTRAYLSEGATDHSPTAHVHAVDVEFPSTFLACRWIADAQMMAHARFRDAKPDPNDPTVVTFALLGFMLTLAYR